MIPIVCMTEILVKDLPLLTCLVKTIARPNNTGTSTITQVYVKIKFSQNAPVQHNLFPQSLKLMTETAFFCLHLLLHFSLPSIARVVGSNPIRDACDIFVHMTRESIEYTVFTHIGVWVKKQN